MDYLLGTILSNGRRRHSTAPASALMGVLHRKQRGGQQNDGLADGTGTMEYAQQIDRTLILPPWVDYNARTTTGQYPWFPWFKEYFEVCPCAQNAVPTPQPRKPTAGRRRRPSPLAD